MIDKEQFKVVKTSGLAKIDGLVISQQLPDIKGFVFPNQDLLFFSDKEPKHISKIFSLSISISYYDGEIKFETNDNDDPSTIFLRLPIQEPNDKTKVEPPGYYPSYAALKPDQKWIYLDWLRDVTQTIDIGYVFIYYYGLERHLLIGKFDRAFDEITNLRRYHRNNSFLAYSESSLINSALLMKRPDKIVELGENNIVSNFSNSLFLIAYYNKYNLSIDNLMQIFDRVSGLNKRYFKEDRNHFKLFLSEVLYERFSSASFPFAGNYDISETSRARYPLFANISLPENIRTPDFPNFYAYGKLMDDLRSVFKTTHEKYKSWKNKKGLE
jgi:hypothetical protein